MAPISWQRVDELERKTSGLRKILIVLIAGPSILNLFFGINVSLLFVSACIALAARIFRHLDSISKELKQLTQGLIAEDQVFNWLEMLPPDWSIERRIEIDYADIDLFVTTPQGISVAIEVKSHTGCIKLKDNKLIRIGKFELEGDFIDTLKKRASKLALKRGLPSIACVIVFTNAELKVPHACVDGVFVRNLVELIPFLHKIDTQTRKYNAVRSIRYNQDLVNVVENIDVVAEVEESYAPTFDATPDSELKSVALKELVADLRFYVSFQYSAKLHQCYKCKEYIVVFSWSEHEMWPEAMPPKPIPRSLKYRYSKSLQKKYWVNTCQKCGATQGDSFVYPRRDYDLEYDHDSIWKPIISLV